ncbi:hypothetical protein, partial [Yersinia pekkanenii]|uniref:hypothetical protein n=1 Tax=Yersinia pekkanenii TaxID=1288385 RepID=UPI00066FD5AF
KAPEITLSASLRATLTTHRGYLQCNHRIVYQPVWLYRAGGLSGSLMIRTGAAGLQRFYIGGYVTTVSRFLGPMGAKLKMRHI